MQRSERVMIVVNFKPEFSSWQAANVPLTLSDGSYHSGTIVEVDLKSDGFCHIMYSKRQ